VLQPMSLFKDKQFACFSQQTEDTSFHCRFRRQVASVTQPGPHCLSPA